MSSDKMWEAWVFEVTASLEECKHIVNEYKEANNKVLYINRKKLIQIHFNTFTLYSINIIFLV